MARRLSDVPRQITEAGNKVSVDGFPGSVCHKRDSLARRPAFFFVREKILKQLSMVALEIYK
jgi:hypothetical protein